ncbi:phytanoyl-CoA dioxygenase family protein [Mucilaginibacter ginsenosidivorans]|uniref:Phytanoyl-CoA dioxygenase family protein n=1 Tax=Mucilaginibacter ginsenosidivorans TaxID=398053 RepID=A0A5B8USU3_9SPHI|nr:phytanoyl-CoA dioxygenase family protein [Mucilaginibacter ginsenosidivorans]QEC62002.1 phytanoyl-CoA dioxygenase family protein [Mucilaginibacter ginsenosidivorans]
MGQTFLSPDTLIPFSETGKLGIMHLKRFWNKVLLKRENKLSQNDWQDEWQLDRTLLSALGLGLEQCLIYIFRETPSFGKFETWIIETAGYPRQEDVLRFNDLFGDKNKEPANVIQPVLDVEQLKCWQENGYVIIRNAVSKDDCEETIEVICDFIGVKRVDPATWYKQHPSIQGIMVQLFQHPLLNKNRQSEKVRMAYEQLWQRKDIWVTADRVGFNPPETERWKFPGPNMHWDCSLTLPIPFSLQGLLYLSDTEASQGAFTLVPGFHNRIEKWLHSLPAGTDPRKQDLHALGSTPIAANGGDFIIWHQALPHGSRPNTSDKPRFVQYFTYEPVDIREADLWI